MEILRLRGVGCGVVWIAGDGGVVYQTHVDDTLSDISDSSSAVSMPNHTSDTSLRESSRIRDRIPCATLCRAKLAMDKNPSKTGGYACVSHRFEVE